MPLSPKVKHQLDQQFEHIQSQLNRQDKIEQSQIDKEIQNETVEWKKTMQGELQALQESWKQSAPHEYQFYASVWHFGHHASSALAGLVGNINNAAEDAMSALFEGLDHLIP